MLKGYYQKYRQIILYLFFGVGTTLVNIIVYYICGHIFDLSIFLSTIIAWILSVLFAYVTNKIWVFSSYHNGIKAILIELVRFVSCRITTGFIDLVIMVVFCTWLSFNDLVIKIISNVIVIIMNYIFSKLIVFKE